MTNIANKGYENYLGEISGRELATVINKAIDNNIKNEVEKNDDGIYINNGINSVNIEVKMLDNDKKYNMESFYKDDMKEFISYYGDIRFKCSTIKYHKDSSRVSYLLYEQITT